MGFVKWFAAFGLTCFVSLSQTAKIEIFAFTNAPSHASDIVSHTFQSWACAVHSWPDYAGNKSHPNIFSRTLLNIIAGKTASPPHFRVGGTSGDRTTFVPSQKAAIHFTPLPGTQIPGNVTIGPVFYEGFETFSDLGTQYIYMVNLANQSTGHIENALAQAQHALAAIGSSLEAVEIGNEPDLYVGQGVRPQGWVEADWVREWQIIAKHLKAQVWEPNKAVIDPDFIYQGLAFSAPDPHAADGFTIANAFNEGIDRENNIKSVSVHNYMTGFTPATTLQHSFMNHTEIVKNVSSLLLWRDYLSANRPNIPLYIAEANSDVVTNTLPITEMLQGVFGNALWKADFLMYAMSQSIPRYYVQQGTGFAFDSWQPVPINNTAPRVLPPWYGDVFVADVVGREPGVQVANIDLHRADLSAYATYIDGRLRKYVVVNLEEWNSTTPYPRPQDTIRFPVPESVRFAEIRYLTAPGAESTTGITWAGQSFNYAVNVAGQVDISGSFKGIQVPVSEGAIRIPLRASEAALVTLNTSKG